MSYIGEYCVYMHINKINGKIYIGQTKNKKERWSRQGHCYKGCTYFYNAIQKYGWNNFKHIILEDNLTQNQANEKEIYYINLYNSRDPEKGYNIAKGGKLNGPVTGEKNPLNKPVICLETLKIYPSARIASQELNIDESCIRKVCRGERSSAGGFHWANYNKNRKYIKPKKAARGVGNSRFVKCIETGEIFNSCIDAAKTMQFGSNISNTANLISRVCRGVQQTTGGYHFCYIEEVQGE